jgi:hypothetical protein
LFGEPDEVNFTLDELCIDDISQVFNEENNLLTAAYSEEEVKKGYFSNGTQQSTGSRWFSRRVLSNLLRYH